VKSLRLKAGSPWHWALGRALQLHALAYNLGNFMRTMPKTAEPWSLISLREKLIKIGANVVSHGRDTDQLEMFRCNPGPE